MNELILYNPDGTIRRRMTIEEAKALPDEELLQLAGESPNEKVTRFFLKRIGRENLLPEK